MTSSDSNASPGDSRPSTAQSEQERRRSAGRRLRDTMVDHAVQQVRIGMAVLDAQGCLIDTNSAFCAMLGLDRAALLGQPLAQRTCAADREALARGIASVQTPPGEDMVAEIRYEHADAGLVWSRTSVSRLVHDTGRNGTTLLIIENIDRLKHAEERLDDTLERLDVATRAAGLGVFEWNVEDDAVIFESPRMRELLGDGAGSGQFSRARLIAEVIDAQDVPAFEAALEQAWADPGAHFLQVCRIRSVQAVPQWVEFSGQVRRDPASGARRLIGVLADVSQRKLSERALADADTRKNDFLTMLAHELRNPLAPIRAASQLVQMLAPNLDSKIHSAGQMIERQSSHLSKLVEQLLEVTRISTGNIELAREAVNLSVLLREALEPMALLMSSRQQTFEIDTPAEPVWVLADPVRMSQVLSNLIDNASKYTANGGHIALALTCDATHCEVSVSDNGSGVPMEMQAQIFEPFVQGEVTVARTDAGLGIGLSVVQQLARLHGGSARVISAGAGAGSTFVVSLPLTQQPPGTAAAPAAAIQASLSEGGRVLVVDDNVDAAESMAELLTMAGCRVETANTAAQALQAVRMWKPEVILLDIGLPDLDGFQVTLELRAREDMRDVLIIGLSGYGSREYVDKARAVGIDIYLTKPAPMEALINAIRQRLRGIAPL